MPFPPHGGVFGPFARPAPRAAGKMPQRSIRGARERHCSGTVRSMPIRGKALSVMELAILPGRPGRDGRSIGGAGATPPKTALACANGPFEEVAPETFPGRKAGGLGPKICHPEESELRRAWIAAFAPCTAFVELGCWAAGLVPLDTPGLNVLRINGSVCQ